VRRSLTTKPQRHEAVLCPPISGRAFVGLAEEQPYSPSCHVMAKASIFSDFLKALKRHWRSALPYVKPLVAPRGSLPKAHAFYAGFSDVASCHVFLHFQTHKSIGGRFTINVILATDELAPRNFYSPNAAVLLGKFVEGPNRIGRFLPTRRGDKWWQMCRDEVTEELARRTGLSFQKPDWWCPNSYENEEEVIRDAIADVTSSVKAALSQLGIPAVQVTK